MRIIDIFFFEKPFLRKIFLPSNLVYLTVFVYFIFPYSFYQLGFSPHTALILLSFFICFLLKDFDFFIPKEKFFIILLSLIFLLKFIYFPYLSSPNTRGLIFSFSLFLLIRKYFSQIIEKKLSILIFSFIFLTIFFCFGQVFIGGDFYGYKNFSGPSSQNYAVGLGNWSNLSCLLMVPFVLFVILKGINSKKFVYLSIAILGSMCIYYTYSRAGWLCLLMALFFHLLLTRNIIVFTKATLIVAISFFLAFSMKNTTSNYGPGGEDSGGRWNLTDYSANTRLATLAISIKAIKSNPLFGIGSFENFYSENYNYIDTKNIDPRQSINTHNAYFQFLSENGIVCSLIFFSYLIFLLKKILLHPGPYHYFLMPCFFGMLFFLIFHDGFHERFFWAILGALSSYSYKKSNYK
jgi:O-antigen ligase